MGLIDIYETVLNRGKGMSIDANTNDPDTNNALMLAAGYLNDLYTFVGNEAYADAANPTISIEEQAERHHRGQHQPLLVRRPGRQFARRGTRPAPRPR